MWFTEFLVGQITWLVVAAVKYLPLAWLAKQLTLAVQVATQPTQLSPREPGPKTRQENHLGTGFPVVKLSSVGLWSVTVCCVTCVSSQLIGHLAAR